MTVDSPALSLRLVTPTKGEAPYGRDLVATLPTGVEWIVVSAERSQNWAAGSASAARVIVESPTGGGMYAALNQGLSAPGSWDWFSYINDDDRLGADFPRLAASHCRPENRRVIAFGRVGMIDEAGRPLYDFPTTDRLGDLAALLAEGIMPFTQQGMIASRDVWETLGGFDARYRLAGDLDFWVRAWQAGFEFRFYDLRVGDWRLRAGQQSADGQRMWAEQERCLAAIREKAPPRRARFVAKWRFRLRNTPNYLARFWRLRRLRQSTVFSSNIMSPTTSSSFDSQRANSRSSEAVRKD